MNVRISYYDINGDSKWVTLNNISTAEEVIVAVNTIALGGNSVSDVEKVDA